MLIELPTPCRYVLSIETAEEIAEYVGDLLQGTDGRKKEFIDELLRRWRQVRRNAADGGGFLHKKKVHEGEEQMFRSRGVSESHVTENNLLIITGTCPIQSLQVWPKTH